MFLHHNRTQTLQTSVCLVALCLCAGFLNAQTLADCRDYRHHGRVVEAENCFVGLVRSPDPYLRAEGFWGLGDMKSANDQFRLAVAEQEKNATYRARWGRLFWEHWQHSEAATLFQEALKIDPKNAEALLGMALVASESFEAKAAEFAKQALESDPKLVEAQELLAQLALEESDSAKAVAEADKALAMSAEALDAMAVHATVEWLGGRDGMPWIGRILKINPIYGEAYAITGRFFVLNRRYEEGIAYYRKALQLNPKLWEARSELGVNLMRLGEEIEAHQQLEECWQNGYQSDETKNSLTLLDSYKNFLTFQTPTTTLRLHKKEADLLRIYFQQELDRALATYEKKYKYHLTRPVQIEVYPDHEDFAVRTMGMPGLGALGVTFGSVVAMDSPSGRKPGSFHWASTMWHELSHVYVLTMTNHKVPRWFTEGLAVYEETAAAPDWGDRLDPESIDAMQKKKLLPVAELDRGFIHPSYPAQVVVSYFQAGRICSYIAERWGYDKLLAMIHDFGESKATPDVIQQELGMKSEQFDQEFLAWLDKQTKRTLDGFAEWKQRLRDINGEAKAAKWDDVIRDGIAIRDIYPDYVEAGSVYEFLSDAYLAKGDKSAAVEQLERYSGVGGRNPATLKKLAELQVELGKKDRAAVTLNRLNYIYPQDEDLHRKLGDLWLEAGNLQGAVREFQAVLASKPLDKAGAHYELARAYLAAGKTDLAKDEVLLSLEAAPGFKAAQKLLLELAEKK